MLAPRPVVSRPSSSIILSVSQSFGLPPRDSQAGKSVSERSDDAAKSSKCSDVAVMQAAADASIRPWTGLDCRARCPGHRHDERCERGHIACNIAASITSRKFSLPKTTRRPGAQPEIGGRASLPR
jgi:hypothetical protein